MTAGTFAVSRKIWAHPEFAPCPFSEREAFLWLVSEASWKERTARPGRVVVDLQRGQLCASVRFMAEAWQWSKSRVDRFIKRLENRDMLVTESGTGQLVITLCNYDEYQGQRDTSGTRAGQTAGHERDTSGTNYKKDEIREKKEIGKPISAHEEKFDDFWQQYPHRNGAKKGKASAQKAWGAAIRARASPDEIIGGAMRYANDRQVLQGYAKDPATWINQKGWNDDIEPDHPRAPPGASIGGPRRPHDSMVAGFAFVANQHARRQEPD